MTQKLISVTDKVVLSQYYSFYKEIKELTSYNVQAKIYFDQIDYVVHHIYDYIYDILLEEKLLL